MNALRDNVETMRLVIRFLSEALDVPAQRILPQTRLRQDLGVNGENADELFRDFSYVFRVNIDGFRINDYFGPGPSLNPIWGTMLTLFGNTKALKTLRVNDLAEAADKGILS